MSRLPLGRASTSKADETFSWMFADVGLPGVSRFNPFRWHDGTAQEIWEELSAKDADEADHPILIKELGQHNFVNVGEVKKFESVAHAVEWLNQNYLNVNPQRLTLAVCLDDDDDDDAGRGLQRMSTDEMVAAGYGGPVAVAEMVGEAAESELVVKICQILDGQAIASSVEIPQLKFGSCRWEYEDDDGSWVPYAMDVCERLSAAEVGDRVWLIGCKSVEQDRSDSGHPRAEYIDVLRPAHDARAAVDEASANPWIWCATSSLVFRLTCLSLHAGCMVQVLGW
jgi:hypothetical protein